MKQRGFGLLLYLVAAIALIGALAGLYYKVHHDGYVQGKAEMQTLWDEANRKAAALQLARERDVSDALKEKEAQRMAAVERAADNETKWKEAVRENRRQGVQLATCGDPQPEGQAAGAPASGGAAAGGVRFTWGFVRLYDGAWTGSAGEPLFGAAAGGDAAAGAGADAPAAGSASPYGPDDLLDVHGENASRDSACRRDYRALIDKVKTAERAWEQRSPP